MSKVDRSAFGVHGANVPPVQFAQTVTEGQGLVDVKLCMNSVCAYEVQGGHRGAFMELQKLTLGTYRGSVLRCAPTGAPGNQHDLCIGRKVDVRLLPDVCIVGVQQ
jgi:hypothetical protein